MCRGAWEGGVLPRQGGPPRGGPPAQPPSIRMFSLAGMGLCVALGVPALAHRLSRRWESVVGVLG